MARPTESSRRWRQAALLCGWAGLGPHWARQPSRRGGGRHPALPWGGGGRVTGACGPSLTDTEAPAPPANTTPAAPSSGQLEAKWQKTRFISFNIPNLHYVEDDWRFESQSRYRIPTEFEIRDALLSVQQLGADVVRIYTLSVRKTTDPPGTPRHVTGPGQFDDAVFVGLDRALAVADELGVGLIIPFVDNWKWWGGVSEYAAFRHRPSPEFWTDPQLIADFEQTIEYVLARRNTLTGRAYRDEPAVFAWETGNELENPYSWVRRIAATIKRLDPDTPVIDGIHQNELRPEALSDPNIDIVSTHHYTPPEVMVGEIERNIREAAGKKPYFVGEFGFIPTADVQRALDRVIQDGAMGALLWSLRFHNRDGGFYWHAEKRGFEAYHWPGFDSGAHLDESSLLALMRRKAHEIRGQEPSAPTPPAPPTLLPVTSPFTLAWQGSVGARSYQVERSDQPDGEWRVIATEVSDARWPYRPLYADHTAVVGREYFYRIRARNSAGASEASAVEGPVRTEHLAIIDELDDWSLTHAREGHLDLTGDDPREAKQDRSRARATGPAALVYRVPGRVTRVVADAFLPDPAEVPLLEGSRDGRRYRALTVQATDYHGGADQYEAFHPVRLVVGQVTAETAYVRVRLLRRHQIGRVEIDYLPQGSR